MVLSGSRKSFEMKTVKQCCQYAIQSGEIFRSLFVCLTQNFGFNNLTTNCLFVCLMVAIYYDVQGGFEVLICE